MSKDSVKSEFPYSVTMLFLGVFCNNRRIRFLFASSNIFLYMASTNIVVKGQFELEIEFVRTCAGGSKTEFPIPLHDYQVICNFCTITAHLLRLLISSIQNLTKQIIATVVDFI